MSANFTYQIVTQGLIPATLNERPVAIAAINQAEMKILEQKSTEGKPDHYVFGAGPPRDQKEEEKKKRARPVDKAITRS